MVSTEIQEDYIRHIPFIYHACHLIVSDQIIKAGLSLDEPTLIMPDNCFVLQLTFSNPQDNLLHNFSKDLV